MFLSLCSFRVQHQEATSSTEESVMKNAEGPNGPERSNRTKRRRLIRLLVGIPLLLVLVALVVFALIPPLIMGDMVNQHVAFAETWSAEEFGLSAARLALTTEDGLNVVAYEVYVEDPHAVVIYLSGIHNPSVTAFFGHARMLHDRGYAAILLEMRAHGESEGDVIALGFEEYLDVQAVVDYIKNDGRYEDTPIVVHGLSMGGAVAINAVGQIPEIDGLISMSAYSSWADVFVDNMGLPEPFASVQRHFVRLYTTLKYGGASRNITPRNEIQKLGDRPAFIIHSRGDSQVPYDNVVRIVAKAPYGIETWVREGDLHFIVKPGQFLTPEEDTEYADKIMGFLDRHFGP
jgi:uncharacterized protein